jgi:hypothetical protein
MITLSERFWGAMTDEERKKRKREQTRRAQVKFRARHRVRLAALQKARYHARYPNAGWYGTELKRRPRTQ